MNVWNVTRFGDVVAETQYGTSQKANEGGIGLPILRMNNITSEGRLDLSDLKHVELPQNDIDRYTVRRGDLLFNRTNSPELVGKMGYWSSDRVFAIAGYLVRVRLVPEKADPRFVAAWFNTPEMKAQLRVRAKPSINMSNISASELLKFFIPLPSLAEQRRIAEVLDRAEALRAKRRAALAQLDTLTQAIFVDMFGDPVVNRRRWSLVKLGDIGCLDRGISKHRPRNAPELLGGPYPLVQTGEIANCDGYVRHYVSTYSEVGLRQSKMWPAGTLCITIAANIAKTGVLTFDACFPDSVVGFRTEIPARVEFVRIWLSFLQDAIEGQAPESAQKNINLAVLRQLDIIDPPLSHQTEFATRIAAIEKLKGIQLASLAQLDALFASLQHRAFRGEL